jgi:hypothetical protein
LNHPTQHIFQKTIQERTGDSPNEPSITASGELLLFTLFSLKSGLTYDLLGRSAALRFVSGMDGSNAKRNQSVGLQVLQNALHHLNLLPTREFKDVAEFETYFKKHKKLLFDATEQRTQRPQEKQSQKDNYSGKKRAYLQINDYFDI